MEKTKRKRGDAERPLTTNEKLMLLGVLFSTAVLGLVILAQWFSPTARRVTHLRQGESLYYIQYEIPDWTDRESRELGRETILYQCEANNTNCETVDLGREATWKSADIVSIDLIAVEDGAGICFLTEDDLAFLVPKPFADYNNILSDYVVENHPQCNAESIR